MGGARHVDVRRRTPPDSPSRCSGSCAGEVTFGPRPSSAGRMTNVIDGAADTTGLTMKQAGHVAEPWRNRRRADELERGRGWWRWLKVITFDVPCST